MPHTWPEGAPFSGRWNKRHKSEAACKTPIDLGWIGEDYKGVWIKRDPQTALGTMPNLWPMFTAWEMGQKDLTAEDYRTLSSYDYQVKLHLAIAQAREDRRGDQKAS